MTRPPVGKGTFDSRERVAAITPAAAGGGQSHEKFECPGAGLHVDARQSHAQGISRIPGRKSKPQLAEVARR